MRKQHWTEVSVQLHLWNVPEFCGYQLQRVEEMKRLLRGQMSRTEVVERSTRSESPGRAALSTGRSSGMSCFECTSIIVKGRGMGEPILTKEHKRM